MENSVYFNLEHQVKCIQLDPDYESKRRFIVGDHQLKLYERTLLRGIKPSILCESEGTINALKWNGPFIAWANAIGVRVYDTYEKCSLGLIKWEEPKQGKLTDFRCNLLWSNATLLIGWAETIRICVIRKRNVMEISTRNLPGYIVDPISTLKMESYVCGLAPLEKNQLVVLGLPKEKEQENVSPRPVLFVIQYKCNEYEELCTDSLTLKDYEHYSSNDYSLQWLTEENKYFLISPKDIITASQYDTDDRVKYLINHDQYEKALDVIREKGGKFSIIQVARLYVDFLLSHQKYEDAAKLCLDTFGNNKDLWEEEVYKFVKVKQLRSISSYLPRTEDCKLNPQVYEMVLYEYLKFDKMGFLQLIKEWQPYLYNTTAVIKVIDDLEYDKKDKKILLEALAILYSHERKYNFSLKAYIQLEHKDVFQLIKTHKLYSSIKGMIIDIMKLDNERAISILLGQNEITPAEIVEQLETNENFLYQYLDAFKKVDMSGKFDWKLVDLYAKYDRDKMLPLMRKSWSYPLQDAYELCKINLFYPEMVYLLDRMGNTKEALEIILRKIKNIRMAIDFCSEHDDIELWEYLINESIEKPEIITLLMDGLSTYSLDPLIIINRLQEGQKIPELKSALIKMLTGYSLQVSIHSGCNEILKTDYFDIHSKLITLQNKASSIGNQSVCCLCHRNIIGLKDTNKSDVVIVFNCKHMFHESCVTERFDLDYCSICIPTKAP
jgi:hypothetical protein